MKKLFSVILAFFILLSLSACNKDKIENNTENPKTSGEEETVTATDIDISGMDLEFTDNDTNGSFSNAKELTGETIKITDAGDYTVSGSLKQILVDADENDKIKIALKDVEITSDDGPAIYINQADKVFLTVAEGSVNTLKDSSEYNDTYGNADGVIFSRADLTVNGKGLLNITSNYKCGIVSKDDLVIYDTTVKINSIGTAIEGKDCVKLCNSKININSNSDGIKSNNSEYGNRGFIYIASGEYDITTLNDGIQAETALIIDNGSFNIKTGGGSAVSSSIMNNGWGNWREQFGVRPSIDNATADNTESSKAIKATALIKITNGDFIIDSSDDSIHSNSDLEISGGNFTISSGDDGIHSDDDLIISSGNITVTKSYEGIEATAITVAGGKINITANDDGFNAAGGNDSSALGGRPGQNPFESDSSASITINDGDILLNTSGDGIDSNGNLTVNGGRVFVNGPENGGNGALDYGGIATVNGGTVSIIGTSDMAQTFSQNSTQVSFIYNFSKNYKSDSKITLSDQNGEIISISPIKTFNSIIISTPELKVGNTYTLTVGTDSNEITLSSISTSFGEGGMGDMGAHSFPRGGMGKH